MVEILTIPFVLFMFSPDEIKIQMKVKIYIMGYYLL